MHDNFKSNAHEELLSLIEKNKQLEKKPKLLLHCCCAPCSTACLEVLKDGFDITCYFFNPNIVDEAEYLKRLNELKNYVSRAFYVAYTVVDGGYCHGDFLEKCKGKEDETEGGARCEVCFDLRLKNTFNYAEQGGYDYFATTLTVSPHKNSKLINEIGEKIASDGKSKYLCTDFKKKGGFARSVALSEEYGLYRQDYCGCEFSKKQAEERKLRRN